MENSGFEAVYTGVYIFVFMAAFTITLYLFMSTNEVAEKAYDYGNIVTEQAIVQVSTSQDELYMSASEVVSFLFNYKVRDLYDSPYAENTCNVILQNTSGATIAVGTSYSDIINKLHNNSKYLFTFNSVQTLNDGGNIYDKPTITIKEVI